MLQSYLNKRAIKKIVGDLREERNKYFELVSYASQERTSLLSKNSFHLEKIIDSYKNIYASGKINQYNQSMPIKWAHFVHKSFPKKYSNNELLDNDVFINACVAQIKFCSNVNHVVKKRSTSHTFLLYGYYGFLDLCLNKNNVKPYVDADIVWHAHMNNHIKYINDCSLIYNRVLDHIVHVNTNAHTNSSKNSDKCGNTDNKKSEKKIYLCANKNITQLNKGALQSMSNYTENHFFYNPLVIPMYNTFTSEIVNHNVEGNNTNSNILQNINDLNLSNNYHNSTLFSNCSSDSSSSSCSSDSGSSGCCSD